MNLRCATRAIVIGVILLVLEIIATGCAVTKPRIQPSEEVRSQVRRVSVVPAAYTPREDFFAIINVDQQPSSTHTQQGNKEDGTVGSGDSKVDESRMQVAEAAWSEGWHMPRVIGDAIAVLGNSAIGALIRLSTHAPIGLRIAPEEKATIEAKITQAYTRQNVQRNVSQRTVDAGNRLTTLEFQLADGRDSLNDKEQPDYRALGASGADTALEVRLKDIGFIAEAGPDPLTAIFMLTDFKAVKVADGLEFYSDSTIYVSQKRKLSEWLGDGAHQMRVGLENGHSEIAERIVEKIFLVQEISPVSLWSGEQYCMFEIHSPEKPRLQLGSLYLSTPQIDTVQPLFRWDVFPREKDRNSDTGRLLNRITDITYDLKIWKAQDGYPREAVYEKIGFSPGVNTIENQILDIQSDGSRTYKTIHANVVEHSIEKKLEPSTVYFWSLRARFKLDGQTRVTKWSYSRVPFPPSIPDPCNSDHIDFMHYYRFATPAQ